MNNRRTETARAGGTSGTRNRASAYDRAYRAGRDLLARQAQSARRLAEKLARRGFSAAVTARVVKEFRRLGYIDDLQLAAAFLRSGSERRLLGRARLEADLRRRGIDPETIDEAMRRHANAVDEDRVLMAALRRYLERGGGFGDAAAVRKGYHHLLRRGFSPDAIRRALEPYLAETGSREVGRQGIIEGE